MALQKIIFEKVLKKDRFLLVETEKEKNYLLLADINFGEKEIKILDFKKFEDIQKLKKPFFLSRVFLALDSEKATTVEGILVVKRAQPQTAISESELDDLVYRLLWEFLNRYRRYAAQKLSLSDLEVMLVGIDIEKIWVETHAVVNPIGMKGKDFSLKLRGTFCPRSFAPFLLNLKKWTSSLVVVESGALLAALLDQKFFWVIHVLEKESLIFSLKNKETIYFKKLFWGRQNLLSALKNFFSLDEKTAEIIFSRYQKNQISPHLKRVIDDLMRHEFKNFKEKFLKELKGHWAFDFRFDWPEFFWPPDLKEKFFSFQQWLKDQGFKLSFNQDEVFSEDLSGLLALVVFYYLSPSLKILEPFLRRRIKWLIPTL